MATLLLLWLVDPAACGFSQDTGATVRVEILHVSRYAAYSLESDKPAGGVVWLHGRVTMDESLLKKLEVERDAPLGLVPRLEVDGKIAAHCAGVIDGGWAIFGTPLERIRQDGRVRLVYDFHPVFHLGPSETAGRLRMDLGLTHDAALPFASLASTSVNLPEETRDALRVVLLHRYTVEDQDPRDASRAVQFTCFDLKLPAGHAEAFRSDGTELRLCGTRVDRLSVRFEEGIAVAGFVAAPGGCGDDWEVRFRDAGVKVKLRVEPR